MAIARNNASYLRRVSVTMPGDGDMIVGYGRENPTPSPVFYSEVYPVLLRVFGEGKVVYHDFESKGTLRVVVTELPPKEELEATLDLLFEEFDDLPGIG